MTLSSGPVNETRAQISPTATSRRRHRSHRARRSAFRASPRSGRCREALRAREHDDSKAVDNLSHQAGAHALRAGVDFLYNDDTITYPRSIRGILRVLVAGELPRRAPTTTPVSHRRSTKPSSRRQIRISDFTHRTRNNTTAITSTSHQASSPPQAGAPAFLATPPGTAWVSARRCWRTSPPRNRDINHPQATILQAHRHQHVVSVGYQHLRGLHLIISVNQNGPTLGMRGQRRASANHANNSHSTLRWRTRTTTGCTSPSCSGPPPRSGQAIASYTWSKSLDNVGEFFFSSPSTCSTSGGITAAATTTTTPRWARRWRHPPARRRRRHGRATASATPGFEVSGRHSTTGAAAEHHVGGHHHSGLACFLADATFMAQISKPGSNRALSGPVKRVQAQTASRGVSASNSTQPNGIRNTHQKNGVFGAGAYPTNPSSRASAK